MLHEALEALALHPGGRYIDATFGGGGHSGQILERIAPDGRLLAFDADAAAQERVARLASKLNNSDRIVFAHANFGDLSQVALEFGFERVDGVLFDFGLSSFQLDEPERGFAFRNDGPLDMRMNATTGQTAADLVATIDEAALVKLLFEYGEESQARRIARAIVREREVTPIETTTQFAELVERAVGGRRGAKIHPATRTFQAIRIAVNDELDSIRRGLAGAVDRLAPGGRLVTIAFHSLEDRIAKQFIAAESTTCTCPPEIPICVCGAKPRLRRVGGSRKPSTEEIAHNPRARSAIMRVAERLPDEETERQEAG
ncbi:16S rRNA (cytosine(1402)-N(4))-methyltransferase RsmH [soil metagenome]